MNRMTHSMRFCIGILLLLPISLQAEENRTLMRFNAAAPVLQWNEGHPAQPMTLTIRHAGEPTRASFELGDCEAVAFDLVHGEQTLAVFAPPVKTKQTLPATIKAGTRELASTQVELNPVRPWELSIVHQTHLDIGYTHVQEEVLEMQVRWLRNAMQYIEQSKDYPPEAQFKWHPEGMWAVEEFMRTASNEEQSRFVDACRRGQIHLDVLYAQAMTGMYSEEELMELMAAAKRFEQKYGVAITSAMQSDVPGYTWGLVTALAHNGVNSISLGPNGGHRVGLTYEWADRPFWWVGPSGQQKVLFYMCGNGYYGLKNADERTILSSLQRLEDKGYPYDLAMVRMLSGADNAPPNPELADQVLAWNRKYASPRVVISTNSEFLRKFGERYGDAIPVQHGDFTPYWEDGCASTSRATGVNRRSSERIAQAQILWAMLRPELTLHNRFDAAWNKAIMYDEHTWGAHNSISNPDSTFAIQQDRFKQAYAMDGARLTDELLHDIAPEICHDTIDVYNTCSWTRSELIRLTAEQSTTGDVVTDEAQETVPSQRLASGELAFLAANVPAFGSRQFTVRTGSAGSHGTASAKGNQISNDLLTLEIDPHSGAIASLRRQESEVEWVDQSAGEGLNSYLYIIGRNADEGRAGVTGPVSAIVEDAGPLVATLRIESQAPGCERLVRRVRLVDGLDHLELINTTHKLKERQPEGLYFGFPFHLPGATARVDVPWAVVEVDKDQLPGANRNYYCVQRWIDLSMADRGVTWVTMDAPMVQFDPIRIAPVSDLHAWRTHLDPNPFFWSWTMNNHWETNYKADQEGEITFRYAVRPHDGGYDAIAAQRFGRSICQPLIAVASDSATTASAVDSPRSLLALEGDTGVVVTQLRPSRDGKAWMVRLFNVADNPQRISLRWNCPVGDVWISNPMEVSLERAAAEIELTQFEVVTLRVEH